MHAGGCTFAEDPARDGFAARILWNAGFDPSVVAAAVHSGDCSGDCFDLGRLARFATIARAPDGREHLALSNGMQRLRLDIVQGSVRAGPVVLGYALSGIAELGPALTTLRRLSRLYRRGTFASPSSPQMAVQARLALALRAYDGLRSGVSHRGVAEALYGVERVEAEWNGGSDSLKSRIRRLAKLTRSMANGGWRHLLG